MKSIEGHSLNPTGRVLAISLLVIVAVPVVWSIHHLLEASKASAVAEPEEPSEPLDGFITVQMTSDGEPVYCWISKYATYGGGLTELTMFDGGEVWISDVPLLTTEVRDGQWDEAYERLGVNRASCEEEPED